MIFNFMIGSCLRKDTYFFQIYKKTLLFTGLIGNVGLLCYFKYADFFIQNINIFLREEIPLLKLTLPLAISFFTFQQIAYLIDSYRNETREYNFLNYAVFVSFFPQLIAGPIVHHKEMMHQYNDRNNTSINYQNLALGLFIFSIGLFKKVVLADTFAIWATNGFDKADTLTFLQAWITSISYTFQLYFDFSGYTDMAIGLALLFNIRIPINFNSPYKATNIQDFWRRWHITLSRFLRNYIYIPLGGNKINNYRTNINILVTFLLGGIWHGAGWTFVFWGLLHGLALVTQRIWNSFGYKMSPLIGLIVTFNFVNLTWIFFRAKEWGDAIKVLRGMFGFNGFELHFNYLQIMIVLFGLIIVMFAKNTSQNLEKEFRFNIFQIVQLSMMLSISIIVMRLIDESEFLYFNF